MEFTVQDLLWTSVFGLLIYFLLEYVQTVRQCRLHYPPGPTLWPIFYNKLLYLVRFKSWARTLNGWRHLYGNVMMIYREDPVVYLHGYDAIREAFVVNASHLSDRPGGSGTHFGITFGSAPAWQHLRKHLVSHLMQPENKRAGLENKIHEEITYLLAECDASVGKEFDFSQILHAASANITSHSLFGQRFDYDAPECSIKTAHNSERYMVLTRVADTFPLLKVFPWLLPELAEAAASRKVTRDFAKLQYDEHLATLNLSSPRDYIDSMLLQTAEKEDPTYLHSFSEPHVRESITSIYIAGADTSRAALCWAFLFASLYPDMQKKIQQEIDDVVGSKMARYSDYVNMPFTQAFLTESMRSRPVGAEVLPHITTDDVIIQGHKIPTGTVVSANIYSVTHDPEVFGEDVETFRPERFLLDNVFTKPQKFIVFGLGRRKCPGESIGKLVTPLYFISVLQHYDIILSEGQDVDVYGEQYGVYMTSPYKVNLKHRCSQE